MKKVFILLFASAFLFSCFDTGGKRATESAEYKELREQLDSLQAVLDISDAESAEMMDVIGDIEANFEKIRAAEKYLSTQSAQDGELSRDTKQKVADNFSMIQQILKQNKAQLAELNKKLSGSNKQIVSLQATINRLNREMEERSERLIVLQNDLAQRDQTISQLSESIGDLAEHAEEQQATIREQERVMNTAYYVFGTMNELKNQKILSGGFMKSTKVMTETFNRDYFLKIDVREVKEIPLYAPKAKLWSTHPEGTYEFVEGTSKNLTLHITDTQRFWSLTKYLIVEVK